MPRLTRPMQLRRRLTRRAFAMSATASSAWTPTTRTPGAIWSLRRGIRASRPPSTSSSPTTAPVAAVLPASFVAGRYRVVRLLGKGWAEADLARDEWLGREVAFAVNPAEGLSAAERARSLREPQAMAPPASRGPGYAEPCVRESVAGVTVALRIAPAAPEHESIPTRDGVAECRDGPPQARWAPTGWGFRVAWGRSSGRFPADSLHCSRLGVRSQETGTTW